MVDFPINPKVQKQYRENLLVPSAPSLISTDERIIPSININTAENPVLCSIVERGELKIKSTTIAVPIASHNTTTYNVPLNKRWILKTVEHSSTSLVGTCVDSSIFISDGTTDIKIVMTSGTSAHRAQYVIPTTICLSYGNSIKVSTQLSAYTSGTITHNISFLEFDEEQL